MKTVVSRARGFTIIELMIVVTIIAILSALAFPAFQTMTLNNRRTVIVNELVMSMMLARAEAAKRGSAITLCGIANAADLTCTATTDWSKGWLVFVDLNNNGAYEPGNATPDVLIKKYVSDYPYVNASTGIKITSTVWASANTNPASNGFVRVEPFNTSSEVVTLTLCDKRGAREARAVSTTLTGRTTSSDKDTNNNNAALVCS